MWQCLRLLCLTGCIVLLSACSEPQSPEEQIRQLISDAVEAGEARSAGTLEEFMHPNFLDQNGNRRNQVVLIMRGLFLRHKSVYLFTKIGEIHLQSETEATVKMYVAMAGQSISDISALAGLRAQLYEFELQLLKDGDWRIMQARWNPANLADVE